MAGYKLVGIMMLLTVFDTLCSGAVTHKAGSNHAETLLGPSSIKVHGPNGKETVLDGPNGSIKVQDGPKGKVTLLNGKVRRETNPLVMEPPSSYVSERFRRADNASVIERVGLKLSVSPLLSALELDKLNASEKVRRQANTSTALHRVLLTKERLRRDAKIILKTLTEKKSNGVSTSLGAAHVVNASAPVTATTPKGVGNMITVPDNCPQGKKFVNGECREIWEPSR